MSLHLIKVQEERLDKTFSEEWIGDVQLKWKHPKYYPQPDKVGKPVDYDLVSVDSGNFVSIHPIVAASSLDRVRKEGCRLRLWLQARSTEIDSLVVIVEISWDGMWVEGNEEMKEHFILTIVNV